MMRRTNMPAAETIGAIGLVKWLAGLILAPWLWHERKRVDELDKRLAAHYTKEEVKEQIMLRNKPIIDKLDMIYNELQKMSDK